MRFLNESITEYDIQFLIGIGIDPEQESMLDEELYTLLEELSNLTAEELLSGKLDRKIRVQRGLLGLP